LFAQRIVFAIDLAAPSQHAFLCKISKSTNLDSGDFEDCIDGFRQRMSRVPADTVDWSHLQSWRCVVTFFAAAERMHEGDSDRAFAMLTTIDSFLAVGSSGGEAWCRIYRVISQMLIGQHYRRLNKTHAACEAYSKAAKICNHSGNSILQLLAPCALSESGAALLSIGKAAEARVALESAIEQLTDLLGSCVKWREVAQSMCKQAGHYWALDGDCWGALFSEAVGMQTVAAFFNLALAHAKQSAVKSCCKCMKQCLAVGKLSLPHFHPILHAAIRPCEAAQQVVLN
jgi:tetratricopeptide (TPR) repeat protein